MTGARAIEDMEDIIDPLLMRKKSGKYIAAALSAAGFGPVREAREVAWNEAVNEADRRWHIGRTSVDILKATNPYREASNDGQ